MKNRYLFPSFLITFALIAAFAIFTGAPGARATDRSTPRLSDHLFARQIAGTYLLDVHAHGIQVLVQLGADGGTTRVSSADAGNGGTAPFASRTPALGNWTRTGDRTIQAVELEFEFDAAGVPLPLDFKIIVDLSFADDWQSFTGTVSVPIYPPGADILEDEPVLVLDDGTLHGRRLR